ncbi:MAG TPA: NUDIX hydrolase [Pirellulaceae bacterium]|jgi:ADP-ribose pyrophosphatase|nr:NUDIX hydrolase [Pirellulaceae bacterium]
MAEDSLRTLFAGRHLHLVDRDGWEFATRPNSSAVVMIAAVTDDRKLVFVEQFRPPVGKTVIELPAGLVGDQPDSRDESPLEGARRELLEETGYEASEWRTLIASPPTPGLTDELMIFLLATGLTRVTNGGGDGDEKITVHLVPIDDAERWFEEQMEEDKLIGVPAIAGLALARSATTNGFAN